MVSAKQVPISRVSKSVGKRLRMLRTKRKISQEKLSWDAGLNRGYVGFIERGARNPSLTTMSKLAKALKVSLEELFQK